MKAFVNERKTITSGKILKEYERRHPEEEAKYDEKEMRDVLKSVGQWPVDVASVQASLEEAERAYWREFERLFAGD
ncbi:hypothetical protein ACXR0O_23320 [Verrucomicrobiota bacterium sgz303538]